ncbi:MAG: methionine ABC transporter permease [Lachnospiraceae bacterium]|jgi:D-methionine transport system permease protein|uniref:ABC transporter permease n=2 Tax=Candidatus Scatomorpha intestinigallinarum TaxID=2840923 RepID=A0A9D1IZ94_9FIRM|nr:ABC transporter permease [Candidatus Scatomorpha intestinigallinarum]
MLDLVLKGLWETIYMTVGATVLAYIVGLPLGLVLAATAADGVRPNRGVNLVLGAVVNVLRSVPFLILLYTVIPVTRFVVGTAIGTKATIVPLFISAFPFVARLVESSAREVDRGVVEASLSMGASVGQVIRKVILPEALPSLINGAAIATTTILGYSAMAGVAGGGGLGAIAINYGYSRYNTAVMLTMCAVIVVVVQCFQSAGTLGARLSDRRIR